MKRLFIPFIIMLLVFSGCRSDKAGSDEEEVILTLGAYTVPKEVYEKELIPGFQSLWLEKTGQKVRFQESYIASGAQSRAILAGFEADIAALSLGKDVNRLQNAGLITHDWKKTKFNGYITRSVVVIVYRPGNPKNIHGWSDLTKEGVDVLYPSPKTSGGAMWDVLAVYGAGLKMSEAQKGSADETYAKNLLKSIQRNVKVMDKSGRASVTTFENGIGDVLLTYENEALLRQKQGRDMPFVIPDSTILIENPIAVIDKNVDKHQNRAVAEAFLEFVLSPQSQEAFARYGFRPVDDEVAARFAQDYLQPEQIFDVNFLGGWDTVHQTIFGVEGIWTQIIQELANE